ncbi:hypothetical protein [Actinosynnema sp. ALI-1.44]|nr:hypothetical protein [Actinosynnema sp. ALI-1.44]
MRLPRFPLAGILLFTAKPSGTATLVFLPLWFLFCLANLVVG